LRDTLSNSDPALSVSAARALFLRGDASGLTVVKRAFLPGPQPLPDNLEETVGNALGLGIRDPALIPDLEELLGSTSRSLRRGAAAALTRTGSRAAVTGLRRALGDSDSEVRYYGVVGLADIFGDKAWRPNLQEFKSNESKYVTHWNEAVRNR
jgi:hypothetical protein